MNETKETDFLLEGTFVVFPFRTKLRLRNSFSTYIYSRFLAKEALQEADHVLQKVMSANDSDENVLQSDQDSAAGASVRNRAGNAPVSRLAER